MLAAIDLGPSSGRVLLHAAGLARLFATVPPGVLDVDDQADHAPPIVGHGDIAEQISRCAIAERTGLVVIGLRPKSRPQPGAIASAVLRNKSAFVLAVPEAAS